MKHALPIVLVSLVASLILVASDGLAQSSSSPTPAAPKLGEAIKKRVAKEPLDLNTASEEELEALPGVGKPFAKKILDGRPFKASDELVSKKILSRKAFDRI